MNPSDTELDALLRHVRPTATVPRDFQRAVWARIEHSPAASPWWTLPEGLAEALFRPRVALAALVALVLISGTAGARSGAAQARHAALERYVATVVMPHHG